MGKDGRRDGNHRFGIETISDRGHHLGHRGHRGWVYRINDDELLGHGVTDLSAGDTDAGNRTGRDRRPEWWALPIRAIRGQAIGDPCGDRAEPLDRLSRLGDGWTRSRPGGRAEGDR